MKERKFFKPFSEEGIPPELSFEALIDPIRSKIMLEIILKGEVTAEMLVEKTGKSRSTISHHLKKLVESGIIEVYMNPVGKVKYYRIIQDIERLAYNLDKEEFKKGTLEERTKILFEICNMFAIVNNIYTNLFSEYLNLLQEHQPFDDVTIDENGGIGFKINNETHDIPYLTFLVAGEEQAKFVRGKIKEVMSEFDEKFMQIPDLGDLLKQPKYFINLQILEYLDEEKLKEKD